MVYIYNILGLTIIASKSFYSGTWNLNYPGLIFPALQYYYSIVQAIQLAHDFPRTYSACNTGTGRWTLSSHRIILLVFSDTLSKPSDNSGPM